MVCLVQNIELGSMPKDLLLLKFSLQLYGSDYIKYNVINAINIGS